MTSSRWSEDDSTGKPSRGERDSRGVSSRRAGRSDEEDERPRRRIAGKKKRPRQSDGEFNSRELLPAAIAVGIGLLFIFPILLSPYVFFLTLIVGVGISIFGFVKGCQLAGREGSFVAIDYLEFLGPLRWVVAVGVFGLYFGGYLLLWTIAQIGCATGKPKVFLPWFGLQAYGVAVVILGLITAGISDAMWHRNRAPNPMAAQPAANHQPASNLQPAANHQPDAKAPPAEAPVVTGDREIDRTLADIGGKNAQALQKAADRLAGMKPNQHRPVVAKKIAEQLLAAEIHSRTPLIRALAVWATAEEVPTFIQLLSDKDINTRNEVLKVIGKLRDERTVKPVVGCFSEFTTRYHGEQALKDMGPLAEKEVLALLDQPDKDLWVPAIYVLKEIGTERSLPALEAASRNFSTKGVADAAIAAINARSKKG